MDSTGSGYIPVARSCDHNNEISGSEKSEDFLISWATITS